MTIGGYQSVGRGSETSMQQYISSSGPLSICVDASSWQSYQGGVLSYCGNSVDHCVQLVGYEGDAWKVRNSWGASWGESGHIRIQIGQDLCAISSEPTKVTGPRVVSALLKDSVWDAWKQEHGKVYNGDDEETFRHGVFTENLAEAAKLQKLNPRAQFGATKFSD